MEGVAYLHEENIIHSDIKPVRYEPSDIRLLFMHAFQDNIVVTSGGDARICDFGGSRIISASKSFVLPTTGLRGTSRYLSYELVVPSELNKGHTKESDAWALGMTIYVRQLRF